MKKEREIKIWGLLTKDAYLDLEKYPPPKTGKQMPITLGLISHFADCPNAKEFRKNPTNKTK